MIATYRDDEVESDHPLRTVLGELASAPGVSTAAGAAALAEAVRELAEPYGADGDALYELTGGNAFYVTEVLALGADALPATVRDAVLARAATLGRPRGGCSTSRRSSPARRSSGCSRPSRPTSSSSSTTASPRGCSRDDGDAVAFRHELARLALESAVAAGRRRRLHAALLRRCRPADGGADPARLAHHAEERATTRPRCSRRGRGRAPLERRRAPRGSAQYARALRFTGRLAERERPAPLERYAGGARDRPLRRRGRGAARGDRVYRALATGSREGAQPVAAHDAVRSTGRERGAERRASTRSPCSTPAPGPELALAYGYQAYVGCSPRQPRGGRLGREGGCARRAASATTTPLAMALNMIGTSYVMAGATSAGSITSAGLSLARGTGQRGSARRCHARHRASARCTSSSRSARSLPARAHRPHRRARPLAVLLARVARAGRGVHRPLGRGHRDRPGRACEGERLDQPDQRADRARPRACSARRPRHGPAARRGRSSCPSPAVTSSAWAMSEPRGRRRRGWPATASEPPRKRARRIRSPSRSATCGSRASSRTGSGEPARSKPGPRGSPSRIGSSWPGRTRRPQRRGRSAGARTRRHEPSRSAGSRRRSARRSRSSNGSAPRPAANAVRQKLRQLGAAAVPRGRRPSTRANPAELTARELDVLRLVVAGKRNAEIADDLVLSTRTIDHHVSAILRKLGVRTRGDAAVAATRGGFLDG